ncbi:hypothetical protein [Haloferula sp.]|uniref:hypothetical protein n=1 Tax=Haloferula sp. TaxID=2497595 RepID=UPI00329E1D25
MKALKASIVEIEPDDQSWAERSECPYLPSVEAPLTAEWTRSHQGRRDVGFYKAALEYAQSLWREGKPAQAILQLNKAWAADLEGGEEVLEEWPLPYRALVWMLGHAAEGRFLGNPVRHFQHLATRIRGEGTELRAWRSWACFHLSSRALPSRDFPPDIQQIETEGLVLPEVGDVLVALEQQGLAGEASLVEAIIEELDA